MNKMNKFDLTGKTALITGASGLLGIEHAIALLEVGADVLLTDIAIDQLNIRAEKLISKYSVNRVKTCYMDVTKEESISSLLSALSSENTSVNILINNAALDPKVDNIKFQNDGGRLENFTLERWNQELAVGLTGAFLTAKLFGQEMANKNGGVILNVASDLSIISPDNRIYRQDGLDDEFQPVKPITYSAIKAALIGMTKYLSTYWLDKNIRVNAISPGGIFNGHNQEFVKKLAYLIPLGRMANHDEYQSAIQFLCSDASSYMNGHNMVMDGGRSVW